MALPPKFKGHRLTFPDDPLSPAAASNLNNEEPLHTLEFYLDYVCPFSAKLFKTLTTTIIPHIRATPTLASRLQLIFRQQIQPWHPSSTLVHEAALAVQRVDATKFWAFSAALFDHQASFFDEAVVDEPRNSTYKRLAELAASGSVGVDEGEVYRLLETPRLAVPGERAKNAGNAVTADVKLIVKMARLTGVHVTPTVMFDGVVVGEISSGWTGEQWEEWLGKNVV
ncbi:thioredoxin-like protein [Chaetomidium leptoderma]|uniref:Thioredoxin-like protein n=1 Tax=Chaetomidium leptoderma TaxID=669021 RepID=A0AAN6VJZ9_9PEZI|nr:thioredoxin-like protein [Chaetomidium leptoderma]